jgi:hypothetical protein
VDTKNRRLMFTEKKILWHLLPESISELAAFHEQKSKFIPISVFPEEFNPLLAKLVQDRYLFSDFD